MTQSLNIAQALKDLEAELKKRSAQKVKDLETLFAKNDLKKTTTQDLRYLHKPNVRLARHFDLEADMLIADQALGSLGIVRVLDTPKSSEQSFKEKVQNAIDQATYVRHLLLTDPNLRTDTPSNTTNTPYTIDLLLITSESNVEIIGEVLRTLVRETDLLHAIGINILPHPFKQNSETVRRALSWLLYESHKWYQSASPPSSDEYQRVSEITLKNFRLPGNRTLVLNPEQALHLVFGRNGSGKSSLAEALELILTGGSERLSNLSDITSILKNDPNNDTKIQLNLNGKNQTYTVKKAGIEPKPDHLLTPKDDHQFTATSFRLDQQVMDHLTRNDDHQRAATFLNAFFSDESQTYQEYHQAKQSAEEAYHLLPENMQEALNGVRQQAKTDYKSITDIFSWFGQKTYPVAQVTTCLPLNTDALEALQPLSAGLRRALKKWPKDSAPKRVFLNLFNEIDLALEPIIENIDETLQTLFTAQTALESIQHWRPQNAVPPDDFGLTLDTWLQLNTLIDLAEKHAHVLQTFQSAPEWQPLTPEERAFVTPIRDLSTDINVLKKNIEDWRTKRDGLRSQLESNPVKETIILDADQLPPNPAALPVDALNDVGKWLLPASQNQPSLGDGILESITSQRVVDLKDIQIGTHNWAEILLKSAAKLRDTLLQVQKAMPEYMTGTERFSRLEQTSKAYQIFKRKGVAINNTFLQKITPDGDDQNSESASLNRAINEIMALFTPARWAYEDISITYRTDEENRALINFKVGDQNIDASLRLNTAELNIFTVALFLLCAPRVKENPFRLLVLDDPLQNMDEMTVTALARGLAKLMHLMPEKWHLIFLLHGEDNLERIVQEAPSTVYTIPWLSPHSADSENILKDDKRICLTKTLQNISELFQSRSAL